MSAPDRGEGPVEPTVVRVGDLVFLDAYLVGLVPAKVTGYTAHGNIEITITATRRGHQRGDETTSGPNYCVPRAHVRWHDGRHEISGRWRFEGLPREFQPSWPD
ncbi:hypothetical protein [Actinokineospora diospyrosa]|uniref:Uncharacterized protein n=1 Tax=Actinokineospora diospyrosa TaxID=103728 RepID=A0ABT1I5N6_9PSEU|nr:hypothetical protein [Actinokineospora diospyrosa]MCP2267942.1 hypothetical protein [Actinokineospora diospyrosa]